MSRICSACGGVLGRDCFNEIECLEISRSIQLNKYSDEYENLLHLIDNISQNLQPDGSINAEWAKVLFEAAKQNKYDTPITDEDLPY